MSFLVLLDRDGVINDVPKDDKRYILSKEELSVRTKVLLQIVRIQAAMEVAVVTNQQCIGKGLISRETLDGIHQSINEKLMYLGGRPLRFYVCGHLEENQCECRKPRPGLILEAMNDFRIEKKKNCLFIGDSETDELAATNAGITCVKVKDETSTVKLLQTLRIHENFLVWS